MLSKSKFKKKAKPKIKCTCRRKKRILYTVKRTDVHTTIITSIVWTNSTIHHMFKNESPYTFQSDTLNIFLKTKSKCVLGQDECS